MSEQIKTGPQLYKRNEYGLLENANYQFNEDGSVNWRAMIPNEFLYVNAERFKGEDVPTSVEGLKDNQLLILLGGIKYLAKIRGFKSVEFDVSHVDSNYVAAKCRIRWSANYETIDEVVYEEVANATSDNTNDFCLKFLETIACNRAFVRCVRNFLNVNIVGADELDNSKNSNSPHEADPKSKTAFTPTAMLENAVLEKLGVDFNGFKNGKLKELWRSDVYKNEDAKNWQSFADIPTKEARKLLAILKKD